MQELFDGFIFGTMKTLQSIIRWVIRLRWFRRCECGLCVANMPLEKTTLGVVILRNRLVPNENKHKEASHLKVV